MLKGFVNEKKCKYIIILVCLVLCITFIIFGIIDCNRFEKNKTPMFIIHKETLNDGGTNIYYGFGYQLIDWKIIDEENSVVQYKVGKEIYVLDYINPVLDSPNIQLKTVEK